MKNYCIFGTNPVLLWSKLRIFFSSSHQEGRLEVVQICCIYLCFSRTDSKFLKWLISLNWVNILMLRPILSSFQSNISMTDYELYWWWQWQQNLKKKLSIKTRKMILTACTDDDDETELFGSNNGGVEVEQSFQKFSPAAFLTNKCLQCRSTNWCREYCQILILIQFKIPYNYLTKPWIARGLWSQKILRLNVFLKLLY